MNQTNLSDEEEAHELLLLQRAIALSNAACVDSSEVSTILHCGNSDDRLESLKKGLTSFHALLIQRSVGGSSHANLGLNTHEVSLSFGASMVVLLRTSQLEESSTTRSALVTGSTRSRHAEMLASFYLFSYPVVFGSPSVRSMDSHPSSSMRNDSSRIGTRSISVLVGCTIFNIALLNHQRVVEEDCNVLSVGKVLMKSLRLYESAQVLLQRRLDDLEILCRQKRKQGPSTIERALQCAPGSFLLQEEKKMLALLLIATWNNMSQIHYFLENFAQSQFCLERLLPLIANTRSCRHDHIATDLLNQVLLNVLLLRKDPHSRPAAAA